jgi:hypothetical protein
VPASRHDTITPSSAIDQVAPVWDTPGELNAYEPIADKLPTKENQSSKKPSCDKVFSAENDSFPAAVGNN